MKAVSQPVISTTDFPGLSLAFAPTWLDESNKRVTENGQSFVRVEGKKGRLYAVIDYFNFAEGLFKNIKLVTDLFMLVLVDPVVFGCLHIVNLGKGFENAAKPFALTKTIAGSYAVWRDFKWMKSDLNWLTNVLKCVADAANSVLCFEGMKAVVLSSRAVKTLKIVKDGGYSIADIFSIYHFHVNVPKKLVALSRSAQNDEYTAAIQNEINWGKRKSWAALGLHGLLFTGTASIAPVPGALITIVATVYSVSMAYFHFACHARADLQRGKDGVVAEMLKQTMVPLSAKQAFGLTTKGTD